MLGAENSLIYLSRASANAPVLLLVHGGPGMDASYFGNSFSVFEGQATVVTYNQSSQGHLLTVDDLVSELREVVQSIQSQQLIVVGHSFGGVLVLEYLKKHGGTGIASALLLNAVACHRWVPEFSASRVQREFNEEIVRKDAAINSSETDERYFQLSLNWTPFYFSTPFLEKGRKILEGIRYQGRLLDWCWENYMNDFDLREVLKASPVPLGLIYSEDDKIVTSKYSRDLASLSSSNFVYSLPNVGHFSFVEDMPSLKSAMLQFITHSGGLIYDSRR